MQSHVHHERAVFLDLVLGELPVIDGPLAGERSIIHQVDPRVLDRTLRREIMRELRFERPVGLDVVAIERDED